MPIQEADGDSESPNRVDNTQGEVNALEEIARLSEREDVAGSGVEP